MVRVRARFASTRDVQVAGNVTVVGALYGNGAYLEGIPHGDASALTRGTIAPERLPRYLGGDATVFTGDSMTVRDLVADRIAGDGRGIWNIHAGNISLGRLDANVLPISMAFDAVTARTVVAGDVSAKTVSGCGAGLTGLVASRIDGVLPQTAFPDDFGGPETRFSGKSMVISGDITTRNGAFCGDGTFLSNVQAKSLVGRIPETALPESFKARKVTCDTLHADIVTGTFRGDGTGLTGLCANAVVSGTVSHDRLPSPLGSSTTHLVGVDLAVSGDLHVGGTIRGNGAGIHGIDAGTLVGTVPASCFPKDLGTPETTFVCGELDARRVQTETLHAGEIHAMEIRLDGANLRHPPRSMSIQGPTTRDYTIMCASCEMRVSRVVTEGAECEWDLRCAEDRTGPGHVLAISRPAGVAILDPIIPKDAFVWIDITSLGLCEELFVSLEF